MDKMGFCDVCGQERVIGKHVCVSCEVEANEYHARLHDALDDIRALIKASADRIDNDEVATPLLYLALRRIKEAMQR